MEIYEIKLHEVMWGGLLVAITMATHGTGMFVILRFVESLKERFAPMESFFGGLGLVIMASLMIVVVNILEVIVWMLFFPVFDLYGTHSSVLHNVLP